MPENCDIEKKNIDTLNELDAEKKLDAENMKFININ